jgi:hypothetical protein
MNYYAGIAVSLEQSSVCVVDATGKIVCEAKVASEPEALVCYFGQLSVNLAPADRFFRVDRRPSLGHGRTTPIALIHPVNLLQEVAIYRRRCNAVQLRAFLRFP